MTTAGSYTLFNLPAQYRPKFSFDQVLFVRSGAYATISVKTNGDVVLSKLSADITAGLYVFFHMVYV